MRPALIATTKELAAMYALTENDAEQPTLYPLTFEELLNAVTERVRSQGNPANLRIWQDDGRVLWWSSDVCFWYDQAHTDAHAIAGMIFTLQSPDLPFDDDDLSDAVLGIADILGDR
jgi:hypothetical protein